MTKIVLSKPLYDKLKKIASLCASQDNRATASPYFYQIRDWKKEWSEEMGSISAIVDNDGEMYETIEEFKEWVEDYYCEDDVEVDYDAKHLSVFFSLNDDLMDKHGFRLLSYNLTPEYKNCFLTEEACFNHLNANRHHYHPKADTYVSYGFRNPDLETVFELLKEINQDD